MYAAAADAVNAKFFHSVHVLSQLLGTSIELALKSYLRYHGSGIKELKAFGHNLGKLYSAAQEFGLKYTGSRSFRVRVLGANYADKIFTYPEQGSLVVIDPRLIREAANDIIREVFLTVNPRATPESFTHGTGLSISSYYPEDVNPSAWDVPKIIV
jgi:hypothetical protein